MKFLKLFITGMLSPVLLFLVANNAVSRTVEIEDPSFDGSSRNITNPYWPLGSPGEERSFGYMAVTEDGCELNKLFVVPDNSTSVDGVGVLVVRDQAWETEFNDDDECDLSSAVLVEDTIDWYAQDTDGNIWYYGEDTLAPDEENPGQCTDEGSWEAGEDDAMAGIVMLAEPQKGDRYRQEFYEGEAEDWGAVRSTEGWVALEDERLFGCLIIKEWTPLGPGEIEFKYYCPESGNPGPGLMAIRELKGKTVNVGFDNDFPGPGSLPGDNSDFPAEAALGCD